MSSVNFFIINGQLLRRAIDRTGASANKIASSGGLSRETLRKALNGDRVTRAKAYGIINGLEKHGVKLEFEQAFEPAIDDRVEESPATFTVEIDVNADLATQQAALKSAVEELRKRNLSASSVKATEAHKSTTSNPSGEVNELEEDLADS